MKQKEIRRDISSQVKSSQVA